MKSLISLATLCFLMAALLTAVCGQPKQLAATEPDQSERLANRGDRTIRDISMGGFSDPRLTSHVSLSLLKSGTIFNRAPVAGTLNDSAVTFQSGIGFDFPIARPLQSNDNVKQSTGSFKSEAKDISFELFEPAAAGKYPTIVMLYGSGGMAVGGPLFQETAKALARQGYVVYLPHYFEKTGTVRAASEEYVKYFAPWMRTITDMIAYAKDQPNVDSKRIGLIGFSLGAYLSLSVACVDNEIKTVVEYFGGLPDIFGKQAQTMPPILILHGDADKAVPVAEAYKLETLLKEKKSPYEIKIYEQQGHGFNGPAAADALQRTLAFFEKNLKGAGQ